MTTKRHYGTKELARDFGELTFGNALESYRLGKAMSQVEFAEFLGLSPSALCDLEKGRRIPTPGRAAKIAKKIKEPEAFWVQLALQDELNKEKLDLRVEVA
ncbi:MAG: helix-turn-helix transcriptional regulator [Pseudomonadota bacterium]